VVPLLDRTRVIAGDMLRKPTAETGVGGRWIEPGRPRHRFLAPATIAVVPRRRIVIVSGGRHR
jgi:hypothetical protein